MPRERSTWNVNAIAKRAGMKVADPYLMNQDHVNQQPSADQYVIGDPSDFAEDVHPSNGTWEAEYAGGQVKRNEIGMPEMRSDTFNHPEKTASEEVITKKAALCVAIARKILPKTASAAELEDQSYSFMYLPDAEVMATYTRLAADEEEQEEEEQGQQVQAGQIPPQFLENIKKKKEEAEKGDSEKGEAKDKKAQDQGQQDQGQTQQKQAQQDQGQQDQGQQGQAQQKQAQGQQDQGQQGQGQGQQKQAERQQQAMQQQLAQLIQQAQQIQQQLAQAQQVQTQQQPGQQQAQMQQQSQAQQVAQAVQQAIAQGQDPVQAAQQCLGQSQQQVGSEIDQMLAEQGQIEPVADMDIQLDTPSMDVGEVQLTPEDDALRQLFSNTEYKNAQEAAGQGQEDQGQGQTQQKQAHIVRTASIRTVGTRPTAGVSQIGGVSSNVSTGRDLSSIWNSAPDVREAFGMRTDQ